MSDPLFDAVKHTQGGVPHLLEALWSAYRRHLQRRLARLKVERPEVTPRPLQEALRLAPAHDFVKFASSYLTKHRPVESFIVDANFGVVLDNHLRVVLCPGTEDLRGTMQDSGAVAVSHGKSQPGTEGVKPGGGIEIR